jgi:Predicted ATPase (AAA+ superfamily)
VLAGTWLAHQLPAWHRNIGKRLVKSPKLHFFDTGIVCALLGIRTVEQLEVHPLRGALFETWVVSELYKSWSWHLPGSPPMMHLSQNRRIEADVLLETASQTLVVEVKSGQTIAGSWIRNIEKAAELVRAGGSNARAAIVYGGTDPQRRSGVTALPWSEAARLVRD